MVTARAGPSKHVGGLMGTVDVVVAVAVVHHAWPGPSIFGRMGRGPARAIKFQRMGPGPARPIKTSEDRPRPDPAHHIFKFSRPGPARPMNFSKVSARPGPARSRQPAHDEP